MQLERIPKMAHRYQTVKNAECFFIRQWWPLIYQNIIVEFSQKADKNRLCGATKAFLINPIAITDIYEHATIKKLHSQKLKWTFICENTQIWYAKKHVYSGHWWTPFSFIKPPSLVLVSKNTIFTLMVNTQEFKFFYLIQTSSHINLF